MAVIDILHDESLVARCAQGNLPVLRGMVEVALHQFAFLCILGDVGERVPFAIDSDESALENIDHVLELVPDRRKLLDMALDPFELRLLHRPFVVPRVGMAENHFRSGLTFESKMGAENLESFLRNVGLEVVTEIYSEVVQRTVGRLAGDETLERVRFRKALGSHVLEMVLKRCIRSALRVAELVLVVFVGDGVLERRIRSLEALHLVLQLAGNLPPCLRVEAAGLSAITFSNAFFLAS